MFLDYVKYFFTGYRTDAMSPAVLSLLATVRFALLFIIGTLAQALADQFAKGNYALDFATIQGYVMPAVIAILYYIWKVIRESSNPFITTTPATMRAAITVLGSNAQASQVAPRVPARPVERPPME